MWITHPTFALFFWMQTTFNIYKSLHLRKKTGRERTSAISSGHQPSWFHSNTVHCLVLLKTFLARKIGNEEANQYLVNTRKCTLLFFSSLFVLENNDKFSKSNVVQVHSTHEFKLLICLFNKSEDNYIWQMVTLTSFADLHGVRTYLCFLLVRTGCVRRTREEDDELLTTRPSWK